MIDVMRRRLKTNYLNNVIIAIRLKSLHLKLTFYKTKIKITIKTRIKNIKKTLKRI